MNNKELLLVYNADSSIFAVASDFVKKIAAPDKYDCQLCLITYGSIKMQNPWKEYLDSLPYKKVFLHRDEFIRQFPDMQLPLPAILTRSAENSTPQILLSSSEIKHCKNLQDLISLLEIKLK